MSKVVGIKELLSSIYELGNSFIEVIMDKWDSNTTYKLTNKERGEVHHGVACLLGGIANYDDKVVLYDTVLVGTGFYLNAGTFVSADDYIRFGSYMSNFTVYTRDNRHSFYIWLSKNRCKPSEDDYLSYKAFESEMYAKVLFDTRNSEILEKISSHSQWVMDESLRNMFLSAIGKTLKTQKSYARAILGKTFSLDFGDFYASYTITTHLHADRLEEQIKRKTFFLMYDDDLKINLYCTYI